MKKITAVALGINLVLLFGMYFWTYQLTPRMAFIDVGTVFAKFQLTEDMNAKASKSKEARQNVLDVMAQKAKLFSAKIQLLKDEQEIEQRKLEFLLMEEEYFKKQQQFEDDNDHEMALYNNQIRDQLNQYVEEYRDAEGYDYILGSTGSGNVMAAALDEDVTDEIVEYINKRYEGR